MVMGDDPGYIVFLNPFSCLRSYMLPSIINELFPNLYLPEVTIMAVTKKPDWNQNI